MSDENKLAEETCEKLVKLPVQYEVQVHVYPQMACQRCHEGVTSAPRQDNRLKADVSVIADVVVKKYVEHQPLYRQQQAFDRLDIPISRQTLCDWTGWCSDQVEPVVKAMADYILSQPLVQSDETPVRMQLADGQMETARLWAYGLPWAEVVFDFRTDKSHKGPLEFLEGTTARFVQADGGSSYRPVFEKLELLHIACMAHIRRRQSTLRSVDYYGQPEGKVKKRALNARRRPSAESSAPAPSCPLPWPRPILEYVRVVVGLIEGRKVALGEVVAMLERTVRQHRMVRRRRIDQGVAWLNDRNRPAKPCDADRARVSFGWGGLARLRVR